MPHSSTIAKLLLATPGIDPAQIDAVIRWAGVQVSDGESIVAPLIRNGLFVPSAMQILDLIHKGFLQPANALVLLEPDAVARITHLFPAAQSAPQDFLHEPSPRSSARPSSSGDENNNRLSKPLTPTDHQITLTRRNNPQGTQNALPSAPVPELQTTAQVGPIADAVTAIGPGFVLGKCLITGLLGKGGHGAVYSALHQSLNIPVAIKVILQDSHTPDANVRAQLQNEARTLARLSHNNVIRVLDYDDVPIPFVVMEYVEGPSLADLISQTGVLRTDRAIDITTQAAYGLAAAWELGIVHRDIKPGNILLTKSGVAKLADLGLALHRTTAKGYEQTPTNSIPVGTCAYMAPEQARSAQHVDFRADIYSLGATFYHAVTGRLPFAARNLRELLIKHATEPVIPPHVLMPGSIDEATSMVIVRMMAKDPEERFSSYAELIDALQSIQSVQSGHFETDRKTPNQAVHYPTPKGSGLIGRLLLRRK